MKLLTIFCFALFPFLHDTVYPASLTSCESGTIVINSQGEDLMVSLFNLNIVNEKGWNRTCKLLSEAKEITFEIDPVSKIDEPIPVYLFADGKLIQEELIRNDEGYSIIHNPEYKYQKRLDKLSDTSTTMATADDQQENKHGRSYGFVYLGVFIVLWGILFYYLYGKQRRLKPPKKAVKKSS